MLRAQFCLVAPLAFLDAVERRPKPSLGRRTRRAVL